MITTVVPSTELGRCLALSLSSLRPPLTRHHNYHAELVESGSRRRLVVNGIHGPVSVTLAATTDNLSFHAHVDGVGFIGGWNAGRRKQPLKTGTALKLLARSINQEIVYRESAALPELTQVLRCSDG